MNSSLELLSIGDASFDVLVFPSETEISCEIKSKETMICFDYGDKIPVQDLQTSIGGNAANNAVGTRRLGINTAAVLTLGDDDIGQQIFEKLKAEEVNLDYIVRQEGTKSNYSTIINFGGERTILSYKVPRDYIFPRELPPVPWAYLTSMGDSFEKSYAEVVAWAKANAVKLAFNPGSRQLRAGIETYHQVLEIAHIVYINRSEAETMTHITDSHGKEKDLLKALADLGPKIPIVTDGGNGSYIYDGQRFLRAGVLPIDAYERTGAGDGFGAGCLAALIKGRPLEEALLWGTVNSASVIGHIGSQDGLLKESELPEWIDRARSCKLEIKEF